MIENRVHRLASAVHQLDHARREARGFDQVKELPRGQRHALGGFQDEAVSGRHRVGQKPERDHAREVERRDGRHHAQRLADHVLVDAGGDVLVVAALHQHRDAARRLHVLDGAAHLADALARSVLPHSLVMVRARSSRFSSSRALQLEQRLDALSRGSAPPAGEGARRGLRGLIAPPPRAKAAPPPAPAPMPGSAR